MGLDVLMARRQDRYQRLRGDGEASSFAAGSVIRVRRRPLRLRRRACKGKAAAGRWKATASGGKRSRLRLMFLVPARRVAALFAELVRWLASAVDAAADCPGAIVFSSQWGLPVLSHSASAGGRRSACRLRAFYLETMSLSTRSSCSGAGSPC